MWEKRIGPMIGIISNIVLLQRAFRKVKILDLWKHERKDWEKQKTLDKYYECSQRCLSSRDKIPDINLETSENAIFPHHTLEYLKIRIFHFQS